ncbi:hypothetical protein H9P43_008066 [Blastocladiella emersonii ATCC 22665]|nr:hypothetical protein H9P43_008066 [Blastocladiella emersonii ATCC 22665]
MTKPGLTQSTPHRRRVVQDGATPSKRLGSPAPSARTPATAAKENSQPIVISSESESESDAGSGSAVPRSPRQPSIAPAAAASAAPAPTSGAPHAQPSLAPAAESVSSGLPAPSTSIKALLRRGNQPAAPKPAPAGSAASPASTPAMQRDHGAAKGIALIQAVAAGDTSSVAGILSKAPADWAWPSTPGARDQDGRSPLRAAVQARDEPLVRSLLAHPATRAAWLNLVDKDGFTPLAACLASARTWHAGVAAALLDASADPFLVPPARSPLDVLVWAAQHATVPVFTRLMHLARPLGHLQLYNAQGAGILHELVTRDAVDAVDKAQVLLERGGVDPSDAADNTWPALHLAACTGKLKMIDVLLAAGAPVDLVCKDGRTPLHVAAQHGKVDAARQLLAAGANPRARTRNGWTVLAVAAANAPLTTVQALVALLPNDVPAVLTNDGESLTDLALFAGRADTAVWLLCSAAVQSANLAKETDHAVITAALNGVAAMVHAAASAPSSASPAASSSPSAATSGLAGAVRVLPAAATSAPEVVLRRSHDSRNSAADRSHLEASPENLPGLELSPIVAGSRRQSGVSSASLAINQSRKSGAHASPPSASSRPSPSGAPGSAAAAAAAAAASTIQGFDSAASTPSWQTLGLGASTTLASHQIRAIGERTTVVLPPSSSSGLSLAIGTPATRGDVFQSHPTSVPARPSADQDGPLGTPTSSPSTSVYPERAIAVVSRNDAARILIAALDSHLGDIATIHDNGHQVDPRVFLAQHFSFTQQFTSLHGLLDRLRAAGVEDLDVVATAIRRAEQLAASNPAADLSSALAVAIQAISHHTSDISHHARRLEKLRSKEAGVREAASQADHDLREFHRLFQAKDFLGALQAEDKWMDGLLDLIHQRARLLGSVDAALQLQSKLRDAVSKQVAAADDEATIVSRGVGERLDELGDRLGFLATFRNRVKMAVDALADEWRARVPPGTGVTADRLPTAGDADDEDVVMGEAHGSERQAPSRSRPSQDSVASGSTMLGLGSGASGATSIQWLLEFCALYLVMIGHPLDAAPLPPPHEVVGQLMNWYLEVKAGEARREHDDVEACVRTAQAHAECCTLLREATRRTLQAAVAHLQNGVHLLSGQSKYLREAIPAAYELLHRRLAYNEGLCKGNIAKFNADVARVTQDKSRAFSRRAEVELARYEDEVDYFKMSLKKEKLRLIKIEDLIQRAFAAAFQYISQERLEEVRAEYLALGVMVRGTGYSAARSAANMAAAAEDQQRALRRAGKRTRTGWSTATSDGGDLGSGDAGPTTTDAANSAWSMQRANEVTTLRIAHARRKSQVLVDSAAMVGRGGDDEESDIDRKIAELEGFLEGGPSKRTRAAVRSRVSSGSRSSSRSSTRSSSVAGTERTIAGYRAADSHGRTRKRKRVSNTSSNGTQSTATAASAASLGLFLDPPVLTRRAPAEEDATSGGSLLARVVAAPLNLARSVLSFNPWAPAAPAAPPSQPANDITGTTVGDDDLAESVNAYHKALRSAAVAATSGVAASERMSSPRVGRSGRVGLRRDSHRSVGSRSAASTRPASPAAAAFGSQDDGAQGDDEL